MALSFLIVVLFSVTRSQNFGTKESLLKMISTTKIEDFFSDKICIPGHKKTYSFQYSTQGLSTFFSNSSSNENQVGQKIEGKVVGRIVEFCVSAELPNSIISYQIFADSVQFGAVNQEIVGAEFKNRFAGEVFAVISNSGKVDEVVFPQNFSQEERNTFRDILISRTFVLPVKNEIQRIDGHLKWRSNEQDPNGQFESEYFVPVDYDKEYKIKKIRLKYLEEHLPANVVPVEKKILPSSVSEFTFGGKNTQSIMDVRNNLSSEINIELKANGRNIGSFKTNYTEQLNGSEVDLERAKYSKSNWASLTISGKKSDVRASDVSADIEKRMQLQELAGATKSEVFSELEDFHGNQQAETKLFLKTKAILILYPQSSFELSQILIGKKKANKTFQLGSLALVKTGHSFAQDAYIEVMKNYRTSDEEYRFLVALSGFIDSPKISIIDEVIESSKLNENLETQSAAKLALGNLGKAAQIAGLELKTREVESILLESLKLAQSEQNIVESLDGLGNLGSPLAIDTAKNYIQNSSARVRESAVSALRFSRDNEVQKVIITVLKSDSEMNVRDAAVRALSEHELNSDSEALLGAHLRLEKSESVKISLVDLLTKNEDRRMRMKSVLMDLKASDPSSRIRAQIDLWFQQ